MTAKIKKAKQSPRQEFGTFIKKKREEKDVTQWEVAEHFKYTTAQFVSNWERGVSTPPVRDIPELAMLIGVSKKDLAQRLKKAKIQEVELEFVEIERGMRK